MPKETESGWLHQSRKLMLKMWNIYLDRQEQSLVNWWMKTLTGVLDEIANVEVGAQDKPLEDVVIETVEAGLRWH